MKDNNKLLEQYLEAYLKELHDRGVDRASIEHIFRAGWSCALDAFDHELQKTFLSPEDITWTFEYTPPGNQLDPWNPEAGFNRGEVIEAEDSIDKTSLFRELKGLSPDEDFVIKITKPK